jgi:hypothetical protein
MAAHRPLIRKSVHSAAAVITLDPAAVGPCGIAARLTVGLKHAQYDTLRAPDYHFTGWVFEPRMHDELAVWIADHVGKDQKILLVCENANYHGTARHMGRAIGCIEGLLYDLNVAHPKDTQYVAPNKWRTGVFGRPLPVGREALKSAAVERVAARYQISAGHDLAEAILMNDYFMVERRVIWSLGQLEGHEDRTGADEHA